MLFSLIFLTYWRIFCILKLASFVYLLSMINYHQNYYKVQESYCYFKKIFLHSVVILYSINKILEENIYSDKLCLTNRLNMNFKLFIQISDCITFGIAKLFFTYVIKHY